MPSKYFDYEHELTHAMFSLFAKNSIMEVRVFDNATSTTTPTYKELLYLYSISTIENCTAKDLVKLFGVSKAMVSQMLTNLENKGFVTRKKDAVDGRKNNIIISPDKLTELEKEVRLYDEAVSRLQKRYDTRDLQLGAQIVTDLAFELEHIGLERETVKVPRKRK